MARKEKTAEQASEKKKIRSFSNCKSMSIKSARKDACKRVNKPVSMGKCTLMFDVSEKELKRK